MDQVLKAGYTEALADVLFPEYRDPEMYLFTPTMESQLTEMVCVCVCVRVCVCMR